MAWPASALTRSKAWGFFFCGMMLLVPARASATSTKPNSQECQTKRSVARRPTSLMRSARQATPSSR